MEDRLNANKRSILVMEKETSRNPKTRYIAIMMIFFRQRNKKTSLSEKYQVQCGIFGIPLNHSQTLKTPTRCMWNATE